MAFGLHVTIRFIFFFLRGSSEAEGSEEESYEVYEVPVSCCQLECSALPMRTQQPFRCEASKTKDAEPH